jgi:hypothetical protein
MTGHGIAEGLVIIEHAHHVRVPEQGPLQVIAVRHRTAAAHLVVGGDLVIKHGLGARVPIGL